MTERSVSKMKWHFWGLILFIGLTLYFHFFTEDRWFPLLDSANLAFHEAGHLFLGILSDRLNVYGGTLLQLAIPVYIYYRFKSDHQFLASSWALVWLAENLFNVARYLGDAQVQLLPLVGGGMHDWTEILSRWKLLRFDANLALGIQVLACLMLLAVVLRLIRFSRSN
jgi:hypothetical protein